TPVGAARSHYSDGDAWLLRRRQIPAIVFPDGLHDPVMNVPVIDPAPEPLRRPPPRPGVASLLHPPGQVSSGDHSRRAPSPLPRVALDARREMGRRPSPGKVAGEDHGVLERGATTLADLGGHRVHGIARDRHAPPVDPPQEDVPRDPEQQRRPADGGRVQVADCHLDLRREVLG
ncbi:hypothetical protein BHM03_00038154, partial [Ensete ventricosum]